MATNIRAGKPNQVRRKIETEASSIFEKILLTDMPRSVFFVKGKVHSCPVGGRLESRYIDRGDSVFIGTYDNRCTVNMIIEDMHLAKEVRSH
ncbi:hypothetical protein EZJ19_03515 [Parasulfuritortus cantonensis]|uniref:Uncharacterized protein n=1 Tax=Parasulfuritortus cantonensis TaxID=2528202 RepID=A0A4R1BKN5_9PROT|nr:hypothetical protein [Parasulfuritortus cantonensis]TCJ17985.1 hypothetical protein EZJ19_03515 [Parasulfuritortus cantonensis]